MSTPRFHRIVLPIVAGVACAVLSLWGWSSDFVTFDETAHIGAGASYVATGDLRLNPEHPPLVKILAGLALAPLGARVPTGTTSWRDFNEWDFGRQFLFENDRSPETLLRVARIPVLLLTVALVALVTLLAQRWFGGLAAAVTGTVAAFDTTVLAHGHLVTTDVPFALAFLLAVLAFTSFLEHPSRRAALLAFTAYGFAITTKFSGLLLLLLLPMLALIRYAQLRASGVPRPWTSRGVRSTAALFLLGGLLVAMASVGFQIRRPIDDPRIVELYAERERIVAEGVERARPDLRFLVRLSDPATLSGRILDGVARTPIPGYPYWRGVFSVTSHSIGGHGSYLLGESNNQGWWNYFPVAFAVKTPSGTLVLAGLLALGGAAVLAATLRGRRLRGAFARVRFRSLALLAVPVAYFVLAMGSNLNLGVRHLLPVYPFLFLGIGALASWTPAVLRWGNRWRAVVLTIALTVPATTLAVAPNFLSAFNSLVGGSSVNGWRYLSDSNLDWGQDVDRLPELERTYGVTEPYAAVFTNAPLERYLPGYRAMPRGADLPPEGPPPGWYVASWSALLDPSQDVAWIRSYRPVGAVGDSILVFRLPER